MTLHLDPAKIVCDSFGGLEPSVSDAQDQYDYWEDFNARFFRANGSEYDCQRDTNVQAWLEATDRASFAAMVGQLLPLIRRRDALGDVDLVLLAHWMPDLHLGTSVTNYAMHQLGIQDGLGFAISDRGLSAPLFALNCAARYLRNGRRKALLMVMDQKHLLYRSETVARLQPENSAGLMVLERASDQGLSYHGYTRRTRVEPSDRSDALKDICKTFNFDPADTLLIADPGMREPGAGFGAFEETSPAMMCAAPFMVLQHATVGRHCLMVTHESGELCAVGLSTDAGRRV